MRKMFILLALLFVDCSREPVWILWEDYSAMTWRPSKSFGSRSECETALAAMEPKVLTVGHALCLPDTVDPRGPKGK